MPVVNKFFWADWSLPRAVSVVAQAGSGSLSPLTSGSEKKKLDRNQDG